jgi:predicted DNA-binding transcriptional regulator YafY
MNRKKMNIKNTISEAGANLHTIIMTAREKDGSIEIREAEPYSYRFTNGHELFFCYDINKQGVRSFIVSNIISVEETRNTFTPRYSVEV